MLEELGPDARLLAGGHSLLPMVKLRLAQPSHVIDIDPLADALGYIERHGDEYRIGAMTRHDALLKPPLHAFHRGPYETAIGPAEMLVEIRVPVRGGSAYAKVDRRVGDWAGAALDVRDGVIAWAGIGLAAVGGGVTCPPAERALAGPKPSDALFKDAAACAVAACDPVTDQRGSKEYKRHVVGVLTERVLRRAAERAEEV